MPDCITLTAPEYDALEDEMRDTIVWELRHTLWAPGTMVVLSVPIRRYPPREAVIDSGSH